MENIENKQQLEQSIINDAEVKTYLLETSKWGKFLAVLGYIGMGFLVLISLFIIFGSSFLDQFSDQAYPLSLFGFIYLIMAAIYYFPVNYLYKFSTQIKEGLISDDQQSIKSGFESLKSLSKFIGIFTIVILSLYALILLVAIPISIFALSK